VNLCLHAASTKAAYISQHDTCPDNSGYVGFLCPTFNTSVKIDCMDWKEESGGDCGTHRNRAVKCNYVKQFNF